MSVQRDYDSMENREEILAELEAQDDDANLPGQDAEPADLAGARQTITAEEPNTGDEVPDLRETIEVEFRGHTFEFAEFGDSIVKAAQMWQSEGGEDAQEGMEFAGFIYSLFGEKCLADSADEAYWRQYDLNRGDDTDDLMDLFNELVDQGVDVPEDAQEQVDTFRDE